MWEFEWSKDFAPAAAGDFQSKIDLKSIDAVYVLNWEEHCLECSAPDCFKSCPLYAKRIDGACARFANGIARNPSFRGPHGYGADLTFKRWGKLEARLEGGIASLRRYQFWASINWHFGRLVSLITHTTRLPFAARLYKSLRRRTLRRLGENGAQIDELLVEAYNPSEPFTLLIEVHQHETLIYRGSLRLARGYNLHSVSVQEMNVDLSSREGKILVYPENDAAVRIIFTWFDFVRYRSSHAKTSTSNRNGAERKKVKCIVWDLDNTIWAGILAEDGPDGVTVRPEIVDIVKRADERGILNSIASKNDALLAKETLQNLGLMEYFLYPQISWDPKSRGLQAIAESLNISLDTIAFVDDSPFERGEISSLLPDVRVLDSLKIEGLLDRDDFKVPVTEESRCRRHQYRAEEERENEATTFLGDYDKFLRSCSLTAQLFTPTKPASIERCLELIQRTNQMNLTIQRYDRDELEALIAAPQSISVATRCSDRFGEYGTVGFARIKCTELAVLTDFVLSCRVMRKRIEEAWFVFIAELLRSHGYNELYARYIPTNRNQPLLQMLIQLGFEKVGLEGKTEVLSVSLNRLVDQAVCVSAVDRGVKLPWQPISD